MKAGSSVRDTSSSTRLSMCFTCMILCLPLRIMLCTSWHSCSSVEQNPKPRVQQPCMCCCCRYLVGILQVHIASKLGLLASYLDGVSSLEGVGHNGDQDGDAALSGVVKLLCQAWRSKMQHLHGTVSPQPLLLL